MLISDWLFGVLSGTAASILIFTIYNHTPEAWLQEWNEKPGDPGYRKSRRLTLSAFYVLFPLLLLTNCGIFFFTESSLRAVALVLYLLFGTLLFIGDLLNRILPNQYLLAVLGVWIAERTTQGILRVSPPFLLPLLPEWPDRLVGAVAIPLLLWGTALLTSRIKGGEQLGFGDIKLLSLCGFITGGSGSFLILFGAVLFTLFAVPISFLLRRTRSNRQLPSHEHTSRQTETDSIDEPHFAEDPRFIPMGPAICLSFFLILLLSRAIL